MRQLLEKNNPILRKKAEPIIPAEIGSEWLTALIAELFAIMKEKAAVGVAAPQIGVEKQVIVFGTGYTKTRVVEEPIPDTVLLNPSFKVLSDEVETAYEGCLNAGDMMAPVPRAIEIEYSGLDIEGRPVLKRAKGLEARIIQHEIDHLNGILFFDHVEDESSLTTSDELYKRLHLGGITAIPQKIH